MISVSKVFASFESVAVSVLLSSDSVVVADSGGGGGGFTTFVCMFPAKADRDSTKSSIVAAQSCWSFFIIFLLIGRANSCKE